MADRDQLISTYLLHRSGFSSREISEAIEVAPRTAQSYVRFVAAYIEGGDLAAVRSANRWSEKTFRIAKDALDEAAQVWMGRYDRRRRLLRNTVSELSMILNRSLLIGSESWTSSGVGRSVSSDGVFRARKRPEWLLLRGELGPDIDGQIDEHVASVLRLKIATDQLRAKFESILFRTVKLAEMRFNPHLLSEALFAVLANRADGSNDRRYEVEYVGDIRVERSTPGYRLSTGAWNISISSELGLKSILKKVEDETATAFGTVAGTIELRNFVNERDAVKESRDKILKTLERL